MNLGAVRTTGIGALLVSVRTARLLWDGYQVAAVASAWPTLTCVLGLVVATRRSRALPAIVVVLGVSVAVAHGFAAVALARGGAFSASGAALLAAPLFALWMAVIAVALLWRPARDVIAQPAAA